MSSSGSGRQRDTRCNTPTTDKTNFLLWNGRERGGNASLCCKHLHSGCRTAAGDMKVIGGGRSGVRTTHNAHRGILPPNIFEIQHLRFGVRGPNEPIQYVKITQFWELGLIHESRKWSWEVCLSAHTARPISIKLGKSSGEHRSNPWKRSNQRNKLTNIQQVQR